MEDSLREQLADLVVSACDEPITAEAVLTADRPLAALGVTSLAQLRLIDAVEQRFGVDVDLGGDMSFLDTLDGLAAYLAARGVQAAD